MAEYTWTIESVDTATNTMVVAYDHAGSVTRYNLAIPHKDEQLESWIDQFAPRSEWARAASNELLPVVVGASGTGSVEIFAEADEQPNMVGAWNEEYLRAMIYSVLEEIREAEV